VKSEKIAPQEEERGENTAESGEYKPKKIDKSRLT
jgi:hypothetical protein